MKPRAKFDFDSKSKSKSEEFANAFNVAQAFLARRGRLGPLYWLIGGREFDEACGVVHGFVNGIIGEALATYSTKEDKGEGEDEEKGDAEFGFLGALIRESRDPVFLRDQTLNVLLAGRDTTACCLTWAM